MVTPAPSSSAFVQGTNDDTGKFSDVQLQNLAKRSKDKEKANQIIAWTKSAYMRCRTVRQQMERQWYINMAFYIGRQNVAVIPISSASSAASGVRLYIPPAPYYRARPVINKIRPIIRKELAKLTAQRPSATVVPSTSEDRDLAASQAAEQIWNSTFRNKNIPTKFRQSVFWMLITGTGFLKHYWDPDKITLDGNQGDFCYENVTPFHLFVPDMLAVDIEEQPYVIHIQTRSVEWVKLNYGITVQPNVMEASDLLNDSFLQLVGAGDFRKNAVLIYEVWVKPNQLEFLPKGGMFTIVGDELVQMVENGSPYIHKQYPFTRLEYVPTGRFYSDAPIYDLVPIQREYNRTRGQLIENKNRMGMVKLMAAEGSIDPSKVNTEPGQAILYKLGFPPPQPVAPAPLPPYVVQEIDRLNMEFEDISGQHEVSRGQAPSGVTAATAISFLQEQDESLLSATFQSIEDAYEKIAYQTLCYVKQYWTVPRMVKVVGRDGQFNVLAFRGSDIGSNTDIRMEAGSALPTSKAAKQALLMDLMSQGFIPPDKGLELMDIGGVQRLYDELQIDSSQASRENMRMSSVTPLEMSQYLNTFMPTDMFGQPDPSQGLVDPNTGQPLVDQTTGMPMEPPLIVPVNTFDNHEVHIRVHNNFRKSQEYETLSPDQKQLFEAHVNAHLTSMGMMPGATPEAQMSMQQQMQPGMEPQEEGGVPSEQETPPADTMPTGGIPNG